LNCTQCAPQGIKNGTNAIRVQSQKAVMSKYDYCSTFYDSEKLSQDSPQLANL